MKAHGGYMRKLLVVAMLLVGTLHARRAISQTGTGPKPLVEQLSDLLSATQVKVAAAAFSPSESQGTREFRVSWTASSPAAANSSSMASGAFQVSSQRVYPERAQRQRTLEMAPGRVLIAAIDRTNQLKSWTVMLDPRIVRAEGPGPDGTLTGQEVMLDNVEFLIAFPDDPEIIELRLFEPRLERQQYTLVAVGSIAVTR
jgi:hypothetical protein